MFLCYFYLYFWFLGACFVQFVTFSLSVPVQFVAWEDSSPN